MTHGTITGSAWGEAACDAGPDVADGVFPEEKGCWVIAPEYIARMLKAGAGRISADCRTAPLNP